jgi:hypothetical protein
MLMSARDLKLEIIADCQKASVVHNHVVSDIENLQTNLNTEAFKIGSKQVDETAIGDGKILQYNETTGIIEYVDAPTNEHTHTVSEITDFPTDFAVAEHDHTVSEIIDFPETMAPSVHEHAITDTTNLQTALDSKANTMHTHTTSSITDFPTSMVPTAHNHTITDITNLQTELDNITEIDDTASSNSTTYSSSKINSLLGSAGYGDMLKSAYDSDNDGKVDSAEIADSANSVDWSNVQNPPTIPTQTSQLTNNSGFITDVSGKVDRTTTINGHEISNDVTITASDIGLGNVDNTADIDKPISTAIQNALNGGAVGLRNIDMYRPVIIKGRRSVPGEIYEIVRYQKTAHRMPSH